MAHEPLVLCRINNLCVKFMNTIDKIYEGIAEIQQSVMRTEMFT